MSDASDDGYMRIGLKAETVGTVKKRPLQGVSALLRNYCTKTTKFICRLETM